MEYDFPGPVSDILIHLGDACNGGDEKQLDDFFYWFACQKARYRIFVPGNHDLPFEFGEHSLIKKYDDSILLMLDSFVEIEGVKIRSVEARPWLHTYPIESKEIDILLTHGTPSDVRENGNGCTLLSCFICNSHPAFVLYGHIHLSEPREQIIKGVQYVNVSRCSEL